MVYINNETTRDRVNWKIYELYALGEYKECEKIIESTLYASRGQCEYAIYVKGLISRLNGNINESLELFQAATALNPHNLSNLKQVARSLYLLGRYPSAIHIYDKSLEILEDDWEIWHNRGLCFEHLKKYDDAIECYLNANSIQRHDSSFIRLANVYVLYNDPTSAVETLKEALEFSPENSKLLTNLGLLYLKLNNSYDAFDILGSSLTLDGTNPITILAAGSIIQKAQDNDVALVKYRIAAVKAPNNSRLWNNIGLCFYAKNKYLESISSLNKAIYLNPFDSNTVYNLGLVYLATGQYASSFQQFSSSINLNPINCMTFMYLGVVLCKLTDFDNAFMAFKRSLMLLNAKKKQYKQLLIKSNNNDENIDNKKNQSNKDDNISQKSRATDANEFDDGNGNGITNEQLLIEETLIRINYCISLINKICQNDQIIQENGFDNTNDTDDDEYDIPTLIEQTIEYKKETRTQFYGFEEIWRNMNNETKLTEFSTLPQTRSLISKLMSLDGWGKL